MNNNLDMDPRDLSFRIMTNMQINQAFLTGISCYLLEDIGPVLIYLQYISNMLI